IEDNKPEAITAMQTALASSGLDAGCARVTVIPTLYPSGGEKQLIQLLTGREVPSGAIPAKLGIVVHNVGTAFTIHQAVSLGKPLLERVVTVTGTTVAKPGNYWLPIGTPVAHVLEQTGFKPEPNQKVIIGGPMMGHALPTITVPILKGTNCILAPSQQEIGATPSEKACIRCGECAQACPAQLLPQQLFWHAKAEEYDKAASYNLKDCIECGCCSYVCPSDIPLVEYYRIAKSALKQAADEKQQAERAKLRFEARLQRLEDEKRVREAKAKEAATRRQGNRSGADKDAIAQAMARIAAKKAAQTNDVNEVSEQTGLSPISTLSPIAPESTALKLSELKSTALKSSELKSIATESAAPDARKAAVAAAVARAKAKKSALSQAPTPIADTPEDTSSQAAAQNSQEAHQESQQDTVAADKQAKIAAAVARAKAKKAAQQAAGQSGGDQSGGDQSGSDLAASGQGAIEESTCNQNALEQGAISAPSSSALSISAPAINAASITAGEPQDAEALKKAKVAAAVARAKAKKAAQAAEAEGAQAAKDDDTSTASIAPMAGPSAEAPAVSTTSMPAEPAEPDASAPELTTPEAIKKAKIAAAVAKAKAKKAAQESKES
ncbi:MAG: electron transport complex subunit RsxC, partial [Shewanella sp.]